jgi:hypothetical protein
MKKNTPVYVLLAVLAAPICFTGVLAYVAVRHIQAENAIPGPTPLPTRTAEELRQYVAEHSKATPPGERIGPVEVGMTAEQCRYLWGSPAVVNRTTTALGTSEQWCYGEWCKPALYFQDVILVSRQD